MSYSDINSDPDMIPRPERSGNAGNQKQNWNKNFASPFGAGPSTFQGYRGRGNRGNNDFNRGGRGNFRGNQRGWSRNGGGYRGGRGGQCDQKNSWRGGGNRGGQNFQQRADFQQNTYQESFNPRDYVLLPAMLSNPWATLEQQYAQELELEKKNRAQTATNN